MKKLKNQFGFTLLEMIIAIALLGLLSLAAGPQIVNAFRDSNKLQNKVEVQNSVTALMNKLETTIKTADVPVFEGTVNSLDFTINRIKMNGDKVPVRFEYYADTKKVNVYENGTLIREYMYIDEIKIESADEYGAEITIVGEDSQYTLNAAYYTRNTKIPE